MSPSAVFLQTLFESGEPVVAAPGTYRSTEETAAILRAREAVWRANLPGEMPAFSLPAAEWAAGLLYSACQLAAWREADEDMVRRAFSGMAPDLSRPEVIYSADIVLCFLPSVTVLAERLAAGDVLVRELRKLAGAWPLSSAGMERPAGQTRALAAVMRHPGLQRLYIDRIILREAFAEAADPAVRSVVATAVGGHGEILVPRFFTAGKIREQHAELRSGGGKENSAPSEEITD